MSLEATMICVDNSEFMRNSDYAPSRLIAQQECTHYVTNVRLGANPESTVGVVSMAGAMGVEMLVSPTGEKSTVLNALSQVQVEGKTDLLVAIQIANLALAHRRNTHGGKRIIIFIGSPIEADAQKLHKLSLQLKKNNVAVDIVSMGEAEVNSDLLTNFVNTASTNDNSSLVVIGAGENVSPLDQIKRSASLGRGGVHGDGGASGAGGAGAGGFGADAGFDDGDDPDMAMAIRISLEQSRADAEAAAKEGGAAVGESTDPSNTAAPSAAAMDTGMDFDDDPELAAAMALSMQGMDNAPSAAVAEAVSASADVKGEDAAVGVEEEEDEDYDEDLAAALALSMEGTVATSTAAPNPPNEATEATSASNTGVVDPDFVREMLGSVGDLDPDDPLIAAALAQINQSTNQENKDDSNGNDKKRKESEK